MKLILTLTTILILLTACTTPAAQPTPAPVSTDTPQAGIPNPASVYCEEPGHRLEIRNAADGSQSGICIFPDGSQCDEWAYYRGECQPASSPVTPVVIEPTPAEASDTASDGCKIYRNPELGYSFHYPAGAEIVNNEDPLHGITVTGPVKDNSSWPAFSIAHPGDREEYRPPEDADLLQWLIDHNLLGETRMPDVQIAGTTAIRFRHEGGPQSYADDRYFFARDGQLYRLLIGHTGNTEDWKLYNHFLESFRFDQDPTSAEVPNAISTARPIDPAGYQGWWTYTHAAYGFSIKLPEDWVVEETTTFDPLMSGHTLRLHPEKTNGTESIRLTFRRPGEEARLWPTGVGQGEFIPQGTLDVAGEPALRLLLVCPSGEVTEIWYHQGEGQPNIQRGGLEFGFIFSAGGYCETGNSLGGKAQLLGEMIIASLGTS